jgi:autotransporter-associated beta strand protein
LTNFTGSSTAGDSTLYAEAGTGGAAGGLVIFQNISDGGTARAILAGTGVAAGALDLSLLTNAGMGIGSIEGAGGIVSLGSKTLTVGGNDLDTTYSGIIRNSGSLTKVGTGALTLSGANTYTGGTTVNNGTLIVNGSIAGNAEVKSGATLKGTGSIAGVLTCEDGSICAPGTSPGTLTVGGLDLMSGSTLEFELGATRDHIVVTSQGGVSLGGVLNISLLDGFIPIEPFSLFEGSIETLSGTFSAVNAPIFDGHTLGVVYTGDQVLLQVVDAGDFNNDGVMDAADYVLWRKGLGTIYTQNDYDAWRAHFGQTPGGSGAVANSSKQLVPEPATTQLLLLACAIVTLILHGRSSRCNHAPEFSTTKEHLPCVA